MKARNCPFCGTEAPPPWVDDETSDWRRVRSRMLDAVGEVSLCAGLGAIAEPYIIAFPRTHFLALAELDAAHRRDLLDALDRCLASGFFPSGKLGLFEHGGSSPQNATGCLEHCHLHVIDGSNDLRPALQQAYPRAMRVEVSEVSNFTAQAGYLFAGSYDGSRRMDGYLVQTPSCGSQFFRRLLATQMGCLDWNWRLSPKPEVALRLADRWREQVRNAASH